MKSSTGIVLLGTFLQMLVFTGEGFVFRLFTSIPTLTPFLRLELAITFIVGALIDIAVGLWFVRSRPDVVLDRSTQVITSGGLAAATTRMIGILIGSFILIFLTLGEPSLRDEIQGPGRDVFLLNMALVSLNPICSGILIGAVFGGVGGVLAKALRGEARQNRISE